VFPKTSKIVFIVTSLNFHELR